jgi:phage terminase Nu1 subunit (DNA packaging protein)
MTSLTVNRAGLAQALGCALTTIDAMVKRWPEFPVVERGGPGRQWEFDAEAVVAFLQGKRNEEERSRAEKDEMLAQLTLLPARRDEAGRPLSIDDEIKASKLRAIQREEMKENRFLVPTHEVRRALERALTRYVQVQESALQRVVKTHNLPEAVERALRREFEEARTAFVRDAAELLEGGDEQQSLFA